MIARAAVLFLALSGLIFMAIKYMAEAKLTREKAAKVVKTTGIVLISAVLASIALLILMLADKLI
jgi:hypothetical protein